jgi:hypothetical protein
MKRIHREAKREQGKEDAVISSFHNMTEDSALGTLLESYGHTKRGLTHACLGGSHARHDNQQLWRPARKRKEPQKMEHIVEEDGRQIPTEHHVPADVGELVLRHAGSHHSYPYRAQRREI